MTTKWIIAPEEMNRLDYEEYEREQVRAGRWPSAGGRDDDPARVLRHAPPPTQPDSQRRDDAIESKYWYQRELREEQQLDRRGGRVGAEPLAEAPVTVGEGRESRSQPPARDGLCIKPVERAGDRRAELEHNREGYVSRVVRVFGVPARALPATGRVQGRLSGIESGADGVGRAVILAEGKLYVVRGLAAELEKRRGHQVTARRQGGRVLISTARVELDR